MTNRYVAAFLGLCVWLAGSYILARMALWCVEFHETHHFFGN